MQIREINHHPEMGIKSATVELTYDEIRDIKNALSGSKYEDTNVKWFYLFEIVKNGCLDRWAIDYLWGLVHPGGIGEEDVEEM